MNLWLYRVKQFLALPNGYQIPHFVRRFRFLFLREGFADDSLWSWVQFFCLRPKNLARWMKEGGLQWWTVRVFAYALIFRMFAVACVAVAVWNTGAWMLLGGEQPMQSTTDIQIALAVAAFALLTTERFLRRMLYLALVDVKQLLWERANIHAHMPAG